MSSSVQPHFFLRLLALTVLLSGLLVWGAADRLDREADQHFQAAAVEECLSVSTCAEDTTSDPFPDSLHNHPAHLPLAATSLTANTGFSPSRARLLSVPGLPRAPPA